MGYRSPLPNILELFDELLGSGRTEQQACSELDQAIRDRALTLLDGNDNPKSESELNSFVIDLLHGFVARDRLSINPYSRIYIKNVRVLRAQADLVFGPPPASGTQPIRQAAEAAIRAAIRSVYDEAQATGAKPPNIKELPPLVLAKLRAGGAEASLTRIAKIGDEPEFSQRRGPVGKRTRH